MRPTVALLAIILSVACLPLKADANSSPVRLQSCPQLTVCFTPGQPCTEKIVDKLAQAKKSVRVQAYYLTSQPITDALLQAHHRGTDVQVILDKVHRTQKFDVVPRFLEAGIPVWIDIRPKIAHSKNMIIDEQLVITGSFNFTASAQKANVETLLIIHDARLADMFMENWHARQRLSKMVQEQ